MEKVCKVCGRVFQPAGRARICSDACRWQRRMQARQEAKQRRNAKKAKCQRPRVSIGEILHRQEQYNQQHPNRPLSYGQYVRQMEEAGEL